MDKQLDLLDAVLAEYHLKLDDGIDVDREQFIADHPNVADELRAHFADVDAIGGLVEPDRRRVSDDAKIAPPRQLGDYELLELVGQGGMGSVYRARQVNLQRIVAVKLLRPEKLLSEDSQYRLRMEAKAAARLDHPGIARVFDFGTAEGWTFISMEFVPGKSLTELVRESPLPARVAAEFAAQIAEAVDYAHEKSVLHRDLKPSNVLLSADGRAMVSDFGLAKQLDVAEALTVTGAVVGTPSYMSPEQASGNRHVVGTATDVYAIGATLYELMTGRPPFRAETAVETLRQVMDVEPVVPRRLNNTIPADLETICVKCLQKNSSARYASAGELAQDLRRFLNGLPVVARPIGMHAKVFRWAKRHPVAAGEAAGLVAVIVVGFVLVAYWAGVASWQRNRAENHFQIAVDFVEDYYGLREQDRELEALPNDLLASAVEHYAVLAQRRPDDSYLQSALSKAHLRYGAVLTDNNLRLAEMEKGVAILEALYGNEPTVEHARELSASLLQLAKSFPVNDAKRRIATNKRSYDLLNALQVNGLVSRPHYERSLSSFNLGHEHCRLGDFEEGLNWLRRAERICRELLNEEPESMIVQSQLAYTLERMSDAYKESRKESERAFQCAKEAVAIRASIAQTVLSEQATADLARSYHRLSLVATTEAEELACYVTAEKLLKELMEQRLTHDRMVARIHEMLAMNYNNWSHLCLNQNQVQLKNALSAARNAKRQSELVVGDNPTGHLEMAYILGTSCYNIVTLCDEMGEEFDRLGTLQQAVHCLRAVAKSDNATSQQRFQLANALLVLGKAVAGKERTTAHANYVEAAKLASEVPSPDNRYFAAGCYAVRSKYSAEA